MKEMLFFHTAMNLSGPVVPSWIVMFGERHEISIDKDMQTGSSVIELTYENTPNELILKKVDVNGNALSGAAFDIWYDGEDEKITKTVDENGELKLERLKPGLWHYQETEAPEDCLCTVPNDISIFANGKVINLIIQNTIFRCFGFLIRREP